MKPQMQCVVLTGLLVATSVAFAQSGWVPAMSRTPITQFNDDDIDMFAQAGQKALEEAPDGGSESWKNESTGHHGTIKVLSSLEIDGKPCRRVEIENQSRSYFNRSQTVWCRHADGDWLWEQDRE